MSRLEDALEHLAVSHVAATAGDWSDKLQLEFLHLSDCPVCRLIKKITDRRAELEKSK